MKKLKIQSQENPLTNRWRGLLIKSMVIILIILVGLELWMVNRLSLYGARLNEIKQAAAQVALENQVLENKIAEASSLQVIANSSEAMGFLEPKSVDYLQPQAVASLK